MTTVERLSVVVPADWVTGPKQGQWTYADYAALPEDGQRYEVVSGVLYMSPSPNPEHQEIAGAIFSYLRNVVQVAGVGKVYIAPLDVELNSETLVQPDVLVVLKAHLDRITKSRVVGAPDIVVEVASPATARHDLHKKLLAYERAGVPEYWIVLPGERAVELLVLGEDGYYSLGIFRGAAVLPSRIVPDLTVRVEQFFA
ncbi:MAG: Uma2 family endonuclease [Chloroflexota bacterium]|nr:Uma2 family endonuclease [Chloroflexota bacterium]